MKESKRILWYHKRIQLYSIDEICQRVTTSKCVCKPKPLIEFYCNTELSTKYSGKSFYVKVGKVSKPTRSVEYDKSSGPYLGSGNPSYWGSLSSIK